MGRPRAYSTAQFVLAVNICAALGWIANAAPFVFALAVRPGVGFAAVPSGLVWSAIVGIPIALLACWVLGAPILWRLMARPIGWTRATLWGLVIPSAIALMGILIGRLWGLHAYLDPSFSFQTGGGAYIQEIDGILTPYGWWVTLQSAGLFVLEGLAVALLVRAIIGPGSLQHEAGAITIAPSAAADRL